MPASQAGRSIANKGYSVFVGLLLAIENTSFKPEICGFLNVPQIVLMSDDDARREFLKLLRPLPPREKIIAFRKWAREEWERGRPVQEILLAAERPPWKSKTDEGEWIN